MTAARAVAASATALTGETGGPHIGPRSGGERLTARGDRSGATGTGAANRAHDYIELWISLSRREWNSLVIIPADSDGTAAEIARGLASIGQRLSYGQVTAITVDRLEYGSALALADLQQHVRREGRLGPQDTAGPAASPEPVAASAPRDEPPAPARPAVAVAPEAESIPDAEEPASGDGALALFPPARLIISVPPVVTEPLSLTATQNADAVVLAVRLNHSRVSDVRRTVELVGRERIRGCLLVR